MAIIVQKFGGTSVATPERIKNITHYIRKEQALGNKVIIVVSAMAGVTSNLIAQGLTFCKPDNPTRLAEYDALLSSGETVVTALMALNLLNQGIAARSFQGWQLPIYTDQGFSKAFIDLVDTREIFACLENGIVPVIAGFQGVTTDNRITTLGRGGSDITALALAVATRAARCDIYTDCEGVFSADPHIVANTKKLAHIPYNIMLELALAGSIIVHPRALMLAMNHHMPIQVLSSFSSTPGTLITNSQPMEQSTITSITYNKKIILLTFDLNNYGEAEILLNSLVKKRLVIELVSYEPKAQGLSMKMLVALDDLRQVQNALIPTLTYSLERSVALLSIVGSYIDHDSSIIPQVLAILAEEKVEVKLIINSSLRLSILLATQHIELIVQKLHAILVSP